MKTSNSQSTATDSKSSNAPKSNTKAHDQLGLTTQADKDAHDLKVAATLAALAASKSAPTRTDITPSKTVSSSDVFTIDVNECIRLREDGNYGIIAPQHEQLNELFIEQAMANKDSWSFDEGGHCLVAISWSAINESLKDADGNPFVDMESRLWAKLPASEKRRYSGNGPVGQPTQLPSKVFGTYKQSFKGQTDHSLNFSKKNGQQGKLIGVYNIVIGNGDLTKYPS
jgi:hypothetical protein